MSVCSVGSVVGVVELDSLIRGVVVVTIGYELRPELEIGRERGAVVAGPVEGPVLDADLEDGDIVDSEIDGFTDVLVGQLED